MAHSERARPSRNSSTSLGCLAISPPRTATPRQRQHALPSQAEFVLCEQTIYTVRQGGPPGGSARHGPPMRRCQAIARTTAPYGVARPRRGGSARSSQRAIWPTACSDTISFRRASCRARCASVHIFPLNQTTIVTAGSDRDQAHRPTQTGSKRATNNCYLTAQEALELDLIAGVI